MLRKIVTYLVFFLIAGGALHSQDIILPEDEAKEALFETRLGDAEVDLYLEGSWNLSLTGGYGFLYDSLSETFSPSVFPGMSSGFLFSQVPDLTISLYLMERYFFEASILDDYEQNTYLLGYNGKPGEFLQRVRIGNTDIGAGTYGFLQVPEASTSALGGTVKFGNSSSTYEGLIRFDPAAPAKVSYLGDRLVKEYHYASTDYQRGRFFILPDRDLEGLKVYVEDDAGTFTGS
ncbi:MAG: hypothetical protein KAU17_13605, partial [Spirochaetales bacterium]|nr:hypothetical protein [Spirochaetales bacterium]